jgi:ribonucleoside-triphosphate reductase
VFNTESFINLLFSPYDKENANLIDANITKEILLTGYIEKELYLKHFLPKYCEDGIKVAQAHESGLIHLHDLNYALTRANCLQHPVDLVFKYGLKALSCVSKPAMHLQTALSHIVNAIAISQGHQCGGQSVSLFNVLFAPYAAGLSYDEIKQALQSFVFQLNQINPSRGFQSAFSSVGCEYHIPSFLANETIEYGPQKGNVFGDFEEESRLILQALVETLMEKDATGKPFLFPNTITNIRENVSADDELLHKVIQCNLETNNTYYLNAIQYGKNLANSMGCRTWLDDTFTGNYLTDTMGCGNFEYGTINLPRVALLHLQTGKPIEEILREAVELIYKGLLVRRRIIWQRFNNGEYPFYTAYHEEGRGYYYNISYTTMSVGFIGMYEFLQMLQLTENDRIKVYEILTQTLNELKQKSYEDIAVELKVDYNSPVEEYTRPSLIATPAEGCSYRLRMKDNEIFGRKMITRLIDNDHSYYVNSDHLPEWKQTHVMNKIKYEELGHQYCNGGNISHLWLTDDVKSVDYNQLAKFIVNTCQKTKLRYFSFNPVIIYCNECKQTYIGSSDEVNCKFCSSPNITAYSKVTGYVSAVDRWNVGKKNEFHNRKSILFD